MEQNRLVLVAVVGIVLITMLITFSVWLYRWGHKVVIRITRSPGESAWYNQSIGCRYWAQLSFDGRSATVWDYRGRRRVPFEDYVIEPRDYYKREEQP